MSEIGGRRKTTRRKQAGFDVGSSRHIGLVGHIGVVEKVLAIAKLASLH